MADLEKLKEQRAKLDKQIRQAQLKERQKQRKADTRRKILAGAVVLAHAEQDAGFKTHLMRLLDEQLEKPVDRELMDLPPRPEAEQTEQIPDSQTPPPLPQQG